MRYLVLFCLVVLPACTSVNTTYKDGLRVRTIERTNWFAPSIAVMEVSECNTMWVLDRITKTECDGKYIQLGKVIYGTQPGAATGVFGAVIQGGAFVGGMKLLGDGIADSGDTVKQSGGGANANAKANARSGSKQGHRR